MYDHIFTGISIRNIEYVIPGRGGNEKKKRKKCTIFEIGYYKNTRIYNTRTHDVYTRRALNPGGKVVTSRVSRRLLPVICVSRLNIFAASPTSVRRTSLYRAAAGRPVARAVPFPCRFFFFIIFVGRKNKMKNGKNRTRKPKQHTRARAHTHPHIRAINNNKKKGEKKKKSNNPAPFLRSHSRSLSLFLPTYLLLLLLFSLVRLEVFFFLFFLLFFSWKIVAHLIHTRVTHAAVYGVFCHSPNRKRGAL